MKVTKKVVSWLLNILAIMLAVCSAFNMYSTMQFTTFNISCVVIACIIFVYKKQLLYLLVERWDK